MFKPPVEKDITQNKKMTASQTVQALFSAQWGFYKHGYETLLKMASIQTIIIILLSIALMGLAMLGNPPPRYIARNAQNQLVEVLPMNEPQRSDEAVRQFVTDAVLDSMNFTYDDYKLRLQKAATYFTDYGFAEWDNALRAGSVYKQLEEKSLLMRTTLVNVPQIDKEKSKAYGNKYVWVVYVDVVRTLSDRVNTKSNNYRYKVMVQQIPTTERAFGLAIYAIKEENHVQR